MYHFLHLIKLKIGEEWKSRSSPLCV